MKIRLFALSAAFIACSNSAGAVSLPTQETYSAAADFGSIFFSSEPYISQSSITSIPDEIASIPLSTGIGIPLINNYFAAASTNFGSNHAYARANALPLGSMGISSFSGWYDQVTITGGSGTGVAHFMVQLNGTIDVGAIAGVVSYGLFTSSIHPSLLQSNMQAINISPTPPWFAGSDATEPITNYTIGASPYNNASSLFTTEILPPPDSNSEVGIPALSPQPFYVDQILTPGIGQSQNITLYGTLNFTYGEAFYLMSGLGTTLIDGLDSFCAFSIDRTCTSPPKDGIGTTTLDFANSANLVNISLPLGASVSFASGTGYNVTSVPEPNEWLMLLTGLGLVGWATRRRA